jgi:NAD(P)-binding Rossmann-like domain
MGQGSSLSRREFLKTGITLGGTASTVTLGLSGCKPSPSLPGGAFIGPDFASGHRIRSQTLPKGQVVPRQARVVILGGGIAGLAAAWSLKKQGIDDFAVLELEKVAGGNSRAHSIKAIDCPMGAHYLPVPVNSTSSGNLSDGLEPVRTLLADLGLMELRSGRWQVSPQGERHLCHSPQERLFFRGAWHEGLLPLADVGEASLQAYRRFSQLIQGFQERGGFHLPMGAASDAAITPARLNERLTLDRITFQAWLGQEGLDDPHLLWYLDYCCRDDYGSGLANVSAWAGVHYFASRHGFQSPAESGKEDPAATSGVFTWPQGNGWLSEKIAAMLGARLQTERLAMQVELREKGLRVTALHSDQIEHWDCQHCVLAMPLFISQKLLAGSNHDRHTLAALQALSSVAEHSSWMVANAYLDQDLRDRGGAAPAWDNVIYGGQGLGYVNARHQSLAQANGPTVLTYYQALGAGREVKKQLLEQPWQFWHAKVLEEFKSAHPDFPERLRHLDIARFGHAMAVPKPGWHSEPLRKARAHLLNGSSPLSFAHGDLAGYSVFEEAFTLGVRAAQRASRMLGT